MLSRIWEDMPGEDDGEMGSYPTTILNPFLKSALRPFGIPDSPM